MMKVTTKSIIIARKKYATNSELPYLVEIKLFDINNPHMTAELPKKELEFKDIECVEIMKLKTNYFIRGNDIVINDAGTVQIEQKKNVVIVEKS